MITEQGKERWPTAEGRENRVKENGRAMTGDIEAIRRSRGKAILGVLREGQLVDGD